MIKKSGFTLIEMSIVLVIIGLIVGGILVGQDLIKGAEARAQIAQIEKYNTAVNTFRNKYGGLPGDLQLTLASQFGFNTSGANGGTASRNGNGIIDGASGVGNMDQIYGETGFFWFDLSQSGLIEGIFPNSGAPVIPFGGHLSAPLTLTGGASYVGDYIPAAKLGYGNFVYVYSNNNMNWYGLSAVTSIGIYGTVIENSFSTPGLTVSQAYAIDKKVDDGIPTTGNIQAIYLNSNGNQLQLPNAQSTDSSTSCYNNTTNTYSTSINSSNATCALSFKFQ